MTRKTIFLSASVPLVNRGTYHETANPFLIQCAVREFFIAAIRHYNIVWGGHPAITPMIWSICEDLKLDYTAHVILYQSAFFEDRYPEENKRFNNVVYTNNIDNDREKSLLHMREEMLSRDDLIAAVFIGGMDGVEVEHHIYKEFHPHGGVLPVPSPGGASLNLAKQYGISNQQDLEDIDYAGMFYKFIKHLSTL